MESCPVHLAIFLRERKPKELNELAILAEQYLDVHANSTQNVSKKLADRARETGDTRNERNERKDDRNAGVETERKCFSRGKTGQIDNCGITIKWFNCGKLELTERNCFQPKKVAVMTNENRNDRRNFQDRLSARW